MLQAVTTARGLAALEGLASVDEHCVALAGKLVLAHRAQHLPPDAQEPDQPEPPPPEEQPQDESENNTPPKPADAEVILEAIKAALPPQPAANGG